MNRHLLVLVSCLCLAACGGGGGGPNEADPQRGDGTRELLAVVLFWHAFTEPPTEDLPLSIEGAGRVELGVVGPEEGTTTLPMVEASAGGTDFDLLAAQLTDGVIDVPLNVYALQGVRAINLGSGDEGALMVQLAPDAAAGVADLAGEQITALQATVRITHGQLGGFTVSGVVRVLGLPQDEPSAERAVALLPIYMRITTDNDYLPGSLDLSTPVTPDMTLTELQELAKGNQGMLRAADDATFPEVAAYIEANPLTPLLVTMHSRPTNSIGQYSEILPLRGDPATDDYLAGLEVSGLRYHSWAALDFRNGLIAGAVVVFASPE